MKIRIYLRKMRGNLETNLWKANLKKKSRKNSTETGEENLSKFSL